MKQADFKKLNSLEVELEAIINGVGIPVNDLKGKEILISGACGFLGSWFIQLFSYLNKNYFQDDPIKVYAIDTFIAADKLNALGKIDDSNIFFRKDDISTMKLEGVVDYIIHAAGIASPIHYRKYPIETIDGMVLGLRNILNFSIKNAPLKSILNFSSSEIYGNPYSENVPTPETYYGNVSPNGPRSCYDESKRLQEAMCASYYRIHNSPVKSVRPFNVYGPGMRITDDRVVPKFMFEILKNENITVHKPGTQTRTFCYITDAMIGFLKVLLIGKNGEVYNIGNSIPEITMKDLAMLMKKKSASESEIIEIEMPTEYPQDQAQRRCPDLTKAKTELNYEPKVTLDEGINRMQQWCKEALIK